MVSLSVDMPKTYKKMYIIIGAVILLVVTASVGLIILRPRSDDNVNELSEATTKSIESFESVNLAYQTGEDQKSVELAKAYSRDESNNLTERLQSYATCILSAKKIQDTKSMDECRSEALVLVATLEIEADRTLWTDVVQKSYDGTLNSEQEPASGDLR
jgi:hypothetical protein